MSTKNYHFLFITLVLGVILLSLVFFISQMDRWSEKWTKWHRIYQNPPALVSSNWSCKSERIASLSHSTSVTLLVRRSSSDSPVFLISQGDVMFRWIEHFKLLSLRVTQALPKALSPPPLPILMMIRFICWVELQNVTFKQQTYIMCVSVSMILLHSWNSHENFREFNELVHQQWW